MGFSVGEHCPRTKSGAISLAGLRDHPTPLLHSPGTLPGGGGVGKPPGRRNISLGFDCPPDIPTFPWPSLSPSPVVRMKGSESCSHCRRLSLSACALAAHCSQHPSSDPAPHLGSEIPGKSPSTLTPSWTQLSKGVPQLLTSLWLPSHRHQNQGPITICPQVPCFTPQKLSTWAEQWWHTPLIPVQSEKGQGKHTMPLTRLSGDLGQGKTP